MQQRFQCSRCGTPNSLGQAFCARCGQSLKWQSQQPGHPNSSPQVCQKCGTKIHLGARFCPICGNAVSASVAIRSSLSYVLAPTSLPTIAQTNALIYQNTSGQGDNAQVPEEIKGWSWGGFLLGWTWGIFNNVWISLLELIPALGLIVWIVLGIYGNEWAWKNKKWDSIESFKNTQKKWALAGVCVLCIVIIIPIIAMITSIATAVNSASSFMDNINGLLKSH